MWGMIVSLIQGVVTGVVGPVFTYLGKKQDVTLEGFTQAVGADTAAAKIWADHDVAVNAQKIQANSWWGPRLLYICVGLAMAMHVMAIALDSTWKLGCGHYGCLGVPPLPKPYDAYEAWVIGSLFVVSLADKPLSAVTQWLHRS